MMTVENRRVLAERVDDIGEVVVSGPLHFPVYELAAPAAEVRWLESVSGDSPWGVWLGHAFGRGACGVLVGTFDRAAFDNDYLPGEMNRLVAAAIAASDFLLEVVDSDQLSGNPELADAERTYVFENARRCGVWDKVRWSVGQELVEFSLWPFAGAWVAVSAELEDVYLAAVGVGEGVASSIRLEPSDGSAFGVDFSHPITISHLQRRAANMTMPAPNKDRLHPDQSAPPRAEGLD